MALDTTGDTMPAQPGATNFDAEPPDVLTRGAVVDRYVLLDLLGIGGMGVVYAAYDPELDRKVALKLLLPSVGGGRDEERAWLLREAQALARLSHPNVVAVHDVGTHREQVWIAMEFVAGETLGAWATAGRRRWSETLRVLTDAARGVAAAHAAGLVHRDLKPDNVMIGRDGRVRVMDFGLAHGRSVAEPTSATTLLSQPKLLPGLAVLGLRLTQTGALPGTPAYMAPEQWLGREAEAATDQFGWCVMAWELLYGERPFAGDTVAVLGAAVVAGQRRSPPRGAVPGWVRRVLERGLSTAAARRWPTMTALLTALERGRTRARGRTAAAALAAVVAVVAGGVGYTRWDAARETEARRQAVAQRVAACEEEGAEIAAVWNEGARQRLRDAFAATGLSYGASATDRVVPLLDAQAAAWREARTEACTNKEVHGVWDAARFDRAAWCLEDLHMALAAEAEEFGRANEATVQKSVTAASSLQSPAVCMDEGLLQRQPAPPRNGREALRRTREALSRAYTLRHVGDFAGALVVLRGVEGAAPTWAPLRAAMEAEEGLTLAASGAYAEAERVGSAAYFTAAEAGAWEVAAGAATELVGVVGSRLARHAEGRAWAEHARVAIAHGQDQHGLTEARRLDGLANIAVATGAFAESKALSEQALAIQRRVLGPDHPAVATSLTNYAGVHLEMGEYSRARALFEQTLEIYVQAFGPAHPAVAAALNNIAAAHEAVGDHAAALRRLEEALEIQKRVFGAEHLNVARGLGNLGTIQAGLGRVTEAKQLFEQALRIREKELPPDHPDLAMNLGDLALAHHTLGALAEAKALQTRSLAIVERALGREHPEYAKTLYNLGLVEQDTGAHAEARARFEQALAIQERALGPNHPEVAWTLCNLALAHRAAGAYTKAGPLFARAVKIREDAMGPGSPDVAAILAGFAGLRVDERRPREALALLERAMPVFAADGAQEGEAVGRFALARALVATRGDQAQALVEARTARDMFAAEGMRSALGLAEVERWLARRAG